MSSILLNAASTSTPLNGNATFTSDVLEKKNFISLGMTCHASTDVTVYVDQSYDAVNWEVGPPFIFLSTRSEVHWFQLSRPWFRVRVVNGSVAQSFLRFTTIAQENPMIPLYPINASFEQDTDSLIVRNLGEEFLLAKNLISGVSYVNKVGNNEDVDTAAAEDIWHGGGIYTGFPTGSPEEIQVFSSNAADTGTLTFTYLATSTSTAWQTATVTLNGTTAVNTGITAYRVHTAFYNSGAASTFNAGDITVRHRTTTANVFLVVPTGRSNSQAAVYTMPYGSTGYIKRIFAQVTPTNAGNAKMSLYIRAPGAGPRLRRPFSCSDSRSYEDIPYAGLAIPQMSDIALRCLTASANNLDIIAGFDIVVVQN